MKKSSFAVLILVLAVTLAACGGAGGGKGKVLVKVGSEKITEGDLNMLATINPRIESQLSSEFGKRQILNNLVEQELFYQASLKDGLENTADVKDKIEIYKKVIISQAYMDKMLGDAAKKYYDEHTVEFEKLKLSNIEIKFKKDDKSKTKRSQKEALDLANELKKKIEAGADFAAVAKESSEDEMSAKKGGDLGFASKDEARLTRRGFGPLLEKAFSMKVGEVAGPIETADGYDLIIVTKGSEVQPFSQVEQSILFKIRGDARNQIISDLKKKYKVEFAGGEQAVTPPATPESAVPAPAPVEKAEPVPAPAPAQDGAAKQ